MSKKINKILKTRDLLFCYQKVAEELFELGEIVMKQIAGAMARRIINYVEVGDAVDQAFEKARFRRVFVHLVFILRIRVGVS